MSVHRHIRTAGLVLRSGIKCSASNYAVHSFATFPSFLRSYAVRVGGDTSRYTEALEWSTLLQESAAAPRSAENSTIEIWQDMIEDGIRPNQQLYFRIMKGLMRANRLSELLYFFQDMKHRGFLPTPPLYNMAIYACGSAKEIEKAYSLYEEMERNKVPRELATYGSLLHACSRCGEFERALITVRDMLNKHCLTPNVHIYTELVGAVRTEEHLEQVYQFLKELFTQPTAESLSPLNRFLSKCIELGYVQRGLACIRHMLTSPDGPKPDIRTFFSAIKALCTADNPAFDEAMNLFNIMKEECKFSPEPAFYEALLRQFAHSDRQEAAFRLFEEMMQTGITPTGKTWYVALMGAISNENEVAAHTLWDRMEESGFLPNIHMCNSYASFCQARGLSERAARASDKLALHPADYLQRSKILDEKEHDEDLSSRWLEAGGSEGFRK